MSSIRFLLNTNRKMKKNYFLFALSLISMTAFSQKTIIVNGGKFGDPSEQVNVMIYDTKTDVSTVIDTIHTPSVQDILIDDTLAYVVAQDSIVLYNLKTELRIAATDFPGASTKTMAISGNELLVGNWYGQDSANLYFYDKSNLNYIDSIQGVSKGAKSILIKDGFAYIPQNSQSNWQDTLGNIIRIDIANRNITDTIEVTSYTLDMGQLVMQPNGLGFYSINSISNTITSVDFATLTATNTTFNQNFKVGSRSQYSIFKDTIFLKMNQGIGAINLNNLSVIDSVIIDTVVTAFTYDTLNSKFYVTQTDYNAYTQGRVYDRAGSRIDTLKVGFSPEVIEMYYAPTSTSLVEFTAVKQIDVTIYPNPTTDFVTVAVKDDAKVDVVMLYNQNGQLVMSRSFTGKQQMIQLQDLDRGIYFLQLRGENVLSNQKIIVQ